MCGGKGTRLRGSDEDRPSDGDDRTPDAEKPLVEIDGVPMVARVHRALADSRLDRVHAVVSPNAPATREFVGDLECDVVVTSGAGYVADLDEALSEIEQPVLTVAADLPLLHAEIVDRVLDAATAAPSPSLAVCVPAALKRQLGVSCDTTFDHEGHELAPTGCNVVAEGEDTVHVTYDARLAVNVNRPSDLAVAEALCR